MLKKIIVSLFILLIYPIITLADVGAPSFTEYSVRVSNKNGTTVQEWVDGRYVDKIIEYDTVVNGIMFEEDINGELYGYSDVGLIKLSDCEILNKELDFKKYIKATGKLYVYKDGAYLYNGPSKIYGKVEGEIMIPVGETVTYTYHDEMFSYVEYKGTKGWVYTYQIVENDLGPYKEGSSLATVETGKLHIVNDATIYNDPYKGESVNVVIPKNTDVDYQYVYNYNVYKPSYYVTYNGTSGWIFNTDNEYFLATLINNGMLYTYEDSLKLCKKAVNNCKDYGDIIPKNQMVPIKYVIMNNDDLVYVENDKYSGWVKTERDILPYRLVYSPTKINIKTDKEEYKEIDGEKTGNVIKKGEVIVYDFYIFENDDYFTTRWFYVIDNKTWIKVNEDDYDFVEDVDYIKDNENGNVTNASIPIQKLITYIVVGTVILSLTMFVIIKLVNKKDAKENKKKL